MLGVAIQGGEVIPLEASCQGTQDRPWMGAQWLIPFLLVNME